MKPTFTWLEHSPSRRDAHRLFRRGGLKVDAHVGTVTRLHAGGVRVGPRFEARSYHRGATRHPIHVTTFHRTWKSAVRAVETRTRRGVTVPSVS